MTQAPIAFFAYNRPDHAQRSLESLVQNPEAAESELFIFCDGAKTPADREAVEEVRSRVKRQAWCGTVHVIERKRNLGLAQSIITGVTDLCDRFGRVIVVEDDLVLSSRFLNYMNTALTHYADESQVMHISGYMFPVKVELPDTFFISNATCWGWATWQRAWKHFNPDASALLAKIKRKNLENEFTFQDNYPYLRMLQKQAKGDLDSWAIRWYASIFLKQGLCLHPQQSLVQNNGHDRTGTHRSSTSVFDVQLAETFTPNFPKKLHHHPKAMKAMIAYFETLKVQRSKPLRLVKSESKSSLNEKKKRSPQELIQIYLDHGRKPWSTGYKEFKQQVIQQAIQDSSFLESLQLKQPLPPHYGEFLDERVIEYPWLFSRLDSNPSTLLDAGSTLNYDYVLEHPKLQHKVITIMTLEPEPRCYWKKRISYQFGDLRSLPFRDDWFDQIVCVSTLEHIGMDNTIYTDNQTFVEKKQWDFLQAIAELNRVTKPGGTVYLSVPYGKYTDFGWYQQFNTAMIDRLIETFAPRHCIETYFCYEAGGWTFGDKQYCEKFEGFNIHDTKYFNPKSLKDYDSDYAACSRAIAALELHK